MIVLSTILADPDGVIELDVDYGRSDLNTGSRRVSRTATLDGGVEINDSGFSHGDRTLKIIAVKIGRTLAAAITNMRNIETVIHLAMFDGFYQAVLKSSSTRNGEANLTVFIKSKLS